MNLTREYNLNWIKKKRKQHQEYIAGTIKRTTKFVNFLDKESGTKTSEKKIKELANRFIK